MTQIERAKSLLCDDVTLAIVCGEEQFTSARGGIAPLLELVESGRNFKGCCVADKIVGKAAAMLYVCLGAEEVYAQVLSRAGEEVLSRFGIRYSCDCTAERIANRKGDGVCPMELAVSAISLPCEAPAVLRATLKKLSK